MTWGVQGPGDGGQQESPPSDREMTPFEIRPHGLGAEVWICVGRFADVAEAQVWVDAESGAEVEWDTLLRGAFRP